MGERIRLQEISAAAEGEAPLSGCSLYVEDGELLAVMGAQASGRRLLRGILTGERPVQHGKLYFREERLRERMLPAEKILRIDTGRRLTRELTLAANLLCLGAPREKLVPGRLRELFREIGIESSPQRLADACPERDQLLLWFAVGILREIPVICVDVTELSLGEEDVRCLLQAAGACRKREISVILFTERDERIFAAADRIAWLRGGAVVRVFSAPEEWRRAFPDSSGEETAGETAESERGGVRLVIDPDWPMGCTLPEYLRRHPERVPELDPGRLHPAGGDPDDVFYVPEDSHLHLMERESIGRNLILTVSRRLGTRFGFVQRDMEHFLEQEFRREYAVDAQAETVQDLTASQKKLLTLYRAALLAPRIVLLENPFLPFDLSQRPQAAALIGRIAAQSELVVVSGKSP